MEKPAQFAGFHGADQPLGGDKARESGSRRAGCGVLCPGRLRLRHRQMFPPAPARRLRGSPDRARACARQSSREPCSMKRSGMPSVSVGSVVRATGEQFDAPPSRRHRRPRSLRSSPAPVCVPARRSTSSSSSGLTKRMFTTVASRRSPMISADFTSAPNARISRPLRPVRRICALPTGSAVISATGATPGPWPRG